jgi:hypothetical protein
MATADAVLNALEHDLIRRPEAPAGLLLREIGAPDGLRRADAIWLPAGHGYGLTGFEVKVSRADVITELASPHKCESWKKYCRYWWLVVADAALIEGLDVPASWGVKTPPTQKNRRAFTVLKPAPELHPAELGPAITRLGSVWAYERYRERDQARRDKHTLETLRGTIRNLEDRLRDAGVATGDPYRAASLQRAQELLDALARHRHYAQLPTGDTDALAAAIVEHLETDKLRKHVAEALDDKLIQIDKALEHVGGSWRIKDLRREIKLARDGGVW